MSASTTTNCISSGSPAILLDIDLSNQFNGPFIGFVLSTILLGGVIVQAWLYIFHNKDPWGLRALVAVLVLLDITTTILNTFVIHLTMVKHFGNVFESSSPKTIRYQLIGSAISVTIIFIVQVFFASRVYILKRVPSWISGFIMFCAVGAFVFGLFVVIDDIKDPSIATLQRTKTQVEFGICHSLAALCDIVVTAALLWSFEISKTGFKETDTLLQNLLQYTLTRGVLATIVQLCLVIVYFTNLNSQNWAAVQYCESKVSVITMVAMLNSRATIYERGTAVMSVNSGFIDISNMQNVISSPQNNGQFNNHDLEEGYSLESAKHQAEHTDLQSKGIVIFQEKVTISQNR
uniref:DUF6534 domain-containing protein n=1 Tax=Moniliophthora roreri TaxID=221103 RepID=A0A0W0GAK0_MONRR